jgi:5'-nucleotidase
VAAIWVYRIAGRKCKVILFMLENIVISNPEKLEESKKLISEAGVNKLHIVTDFDRTLTTAFVDGKSIPSLISVLRDGNYLTPDYAPKANRLYAKYHPIEIDPKIPFEEKKKAMYEWWATHFDLLIKSGLNKRDLKRVVESQKVKLRDGFGDFIVFLKTHNIPLVIISSSGLGGDTISMYLEKEGKLYNNVHIISNSYEWDENDNAIAIRQPIIHMLNKDKTVIQNLPVFNVIKNRKNILLLGDSLDDIGMIKGFDYNNLIKIGFLNENIEENLEHYKYNFDIVILNGYTMDYINVLLRELFS